MAMTTKWSLDIRGHEFDDTEALRRAILGSTCLVSLNSLSLNDPQDENIRQSLQRDRSLAALLRHVTYAARDAFLCRRTGCLSCFFGSKEFEV